MSCPHNFSPVSIVRTGAAAGSMSNVETRVDSLVTSTPSRSLFDYLHHDMWLQFGDARINKFPLFQSGPWSLISIILFYLAFILVIGPNYMRNRKPFDLKGPVFWYNVSMVTLNGYMFIHGLFLTNFGLDAWGCQTVDTTLKGESVERIKLTVGYLFFTSKIIELFDTVIFVLRKKKTQVTPLHVIHHSLVPILMWVGFKLSPGGNAVFFPLVNALIHTIMYAYYALSTFGPWIRPYLWWKKYLTRIQMIQFVLVIIHSLHVLFIPSCNFPKILLYLGVSNAFLFLVLFYSFYVHTYRAIEAKAKAKICIKSCEDTTEKGSFQNFQSSFGDTNDKGLSQNFNNGSFGNLKKRSMAPVTSQLATMCFPELNNNQGEESKL